MINNKTWYDFLDKINQEWKKLTDDTYFDNENLKKSCKEISDDILDRTVVNRIQLLQDVQKRVIRLSKEEMNHHLEQHNLYKQLIENYEKI